MYYDGIGFHGLQLTDVGNKNNNQANRYSLISKNR